MILFSQNKIKVLNTTLSKLPVLSDHKGKIKDHIHWTDTEGEHTIIICETGVTPSKNSTADMESNEASVYAYKYTVKDGTISLNWKIQDFVRDCPFDITATFVKNTLQVTDLDDDGIAEVWVMYKVTCRSDVSPCNMKIIMYEGSDKYAMRGENKVTAGDDTFIGGEYKFDEAFDTAPKSFRNFAINIWDANILENWEK